jgi:hypothetical protein
MFKGLIITGPDCAGSDSMGTRCAGPDRSCITGYRVSHCVHCEKKLDIPCRCSLFFFIILKFLPVKTFLNLVCNTY